MEILQPADYDFKIYISAQCNAHVQYMIYALRGL